MREAVHNVNRVTVPSRGPCRRAVEAIKKRASVG
jgi:hypothetical protein